MLKQAIRAAVPGFVQRLYDDTMDRKRLHRLPRGRFDTSGLRTIGSFDLCRYYSDPENTAAWEIDHAAISRLYRDTEIYYGVNPGDRRAIYSLIMALKPRSVLEVGTHIGASTIHIAAALKRLGERGHLTTIDIEDVNHSQHGPWTKAGMRNSPSDAAKELGLQDQIEFRTGPCQDFMDATDRRFDLIFLDGAHASTNVYEELGKALPLLNKDGVILLHDYYPDGKALFPDGQTLAGPFLAMARVRSENPNIDVLPLGALPWRTKQGSNLTTLALVAKKMALPN